MDQTEALPDDALAGIVGRLPPRDLAACRCVRKAWRVIVDASSLLLPHVVPRTLRGLFLNYSNSAQPRFFASPAASTLLPAVDGDLGFLPHYGSGSRRIVDHCNGLLLYRDLRRLSVVNPATRRWEDLEDDGYDVCLVFDPAVSPHYEVFSVRLEPGKVIENPAEPDLIECPPSSWALNVFSSSTRQWQKRKFVRKAEAPETVTNVQLDPAELRSMWCSGSVYWRGSLYLHCCGVFVVRLSLSDRKYRVIKAPINIDECKQARPYIGKSEKGVYFASMHDGFRLQVWTLMESSERVDWVSKNIIDLKACATVKSHGSHSMEGTVKTWILDGDDDNDVDGNNARTMRETLDWDSDDDSIVNIEDAYEGICNDIRFLGFHPYKEVIFLGLTSSHGGVGVACHLNSSKFQYLGILSQHTYWLGIQGSFPYTPCITGHLLKRFRE